MCEYDKRVEWFLHENHIPLTEMNEKPINSNLFIVVVLFLHHYNFIFYTHTHTATNTYVTSIYIYA